MMGTTTGHLLQNGQRIYFCAGLYREHYRQQEDYGELYEEPVYLQWGVYGCVHREPVFEGKVLQPGDWEFLHGGQLSWEFAGAAGEEPVYVCGE